MGCTKFLGITLRNMVDSVIQKDKLSDQMLYNSQSRQLYLVFERATRGTARECLTKEVRNASFVDSWSITAKALSSIGSGLNTLHDHGVIHR